MKKTVFILTILTMVFMLTACSDKGNIDNVQIPDWEPSEIYSDKDIEAAFQTVKDYFHDTFPGCTLTELYYPGDSYADKFHAWAEDYRADEVIVLYSSFDVNWQGGDGSLNPNSTYDNFMWILVRNTGENWKHVDHGY